MSNDYIHVLGRDRIREFRRRIIDAHYHDDPRTPLRELSKSGCATLHLVRRFSRALTPRRESFRSNVYIPVFIDQIEEMSNEELLGLHNVGQDSVDKILQAVHDYRFTTP